MILVFVVVVCLVLNIIPKKTFSFFFGAGGAGYDGEGCDIFVRWPLGGLRSFEGDGVESLEEVIFLRDGDGVAPAVVEEAVEFVEEFAGVAEEDLEVVVAGVLYV